MNKKVLLVIIFILLVIAVSLFYWQREKNDYSMNWPPSATQEERERAKQLPQERCGCWDSTSEICLPQADCF